MSINVKYFSCVGVYSVVLKSSPVGICVFSLVFGKFKHLKQKDFLLQKALSKPLSGILPSNFFIIFLTLSCLFQKGLRVAYVTCLFLPPIYHVHHHVIPTCRTTSTLGNQRGESPNRADGSKQNRLTSAALRAACEPQPEPRPKRTAAPSDR